MAKCNLSLEYLKVTEAMAKCNLSLNYSKKIFWSDWTDVAMSITSVGGEWEKKKKKKLPGERYASLLPMPVRPWSSEESGAATKKYYTTLNSQITYLLPTY